MLKKSDELIKWLYQLDSGNTLLESQQRKEIWTNRWVEEGNDKKPLVFYANVNVLTTKFNDTFLGKNGWILFFKDLDRKTGFVNIVLKQIGTPDRELLLSVYDFDYFLRGSDNVLGYESVALSYIVGKANKVMKEKQ